MKGEIDGQPQDHSKATYTKKFSKADGEIDLQGEETEVLIGAHRTPPYVWAVRDLQAPSSAVTAGGVG